MHFAPRGVERRLETVPSGAASWLARVLSTCAGDRGTSPPETGRLTLEVVQNVGAGHIGKALQGDEQYREFSRDGNTLLLGGIVGPVTHDIGLHETRLARCVETSDERPEFDGRIDCFRVPLSGLQ